MMHQANLQRTISKLVLDTHKQMRARAKETELYALGEREHQFQHSFQGSVGTLPSETTFQILFDVFFLFDAGYQRDSQIGEPQVKFSFKLSSAPQGTIPYAYVSSWVQNSNLDYVGANVTVGVHNPRFAIEGAGETSTRQFAGVVHSTFQGFGYLYDSNDGMDDAGAAVTG